jgi:hypothetical protein
VEGLGVVKVIIRCKVRGCRNVLLTVTKPVPAHFGDNDLLQVPLCRNHGGLTQTLRLLDRGGDTSVSLHGIHAWKMRELIEKSWRTGKAVTYAL